MKEVLLPTKINYTEVGPDKGKVVIEPCYPGYGLTIGNSIRRVLVSSLPGAAVTTVKIKGVDHEFSTLPHVKEDIVDILLNIKLLHIQLLDTESSTISIKAKGEKKVTAKDIETKSDVKIASPNLHIATLTDKSAEFEMEMTVETGLGYDPVETREREREKPEIGTIAIDAIFSPVTKARFDVENVRVEQMTNFDKLTLEIETDSTITPQDAFNKACQVLLDHYNILLDSFTAKTEKKETDTKDKDEPSEKEEAEEEKEEKDNQED